MVTYKLTKNNNKTSKVFGKWFAKATTTAMEFDEFIAHMAAHHCVYSEATIRGVLLEMEICLREQLLEGKAVRFHDLGIFSIGIQNTKGGVAKPDDFNIARNISGVRMNLYLGKRFRKAGLYADAKFKEAGEYSVERDGDTPTDSGNTAGGGSTRPSDTPGEND